MVCNRSIDHRNYHNYYIYISPSPSLSLSVPFDLRIAFDGARSGSRSCDRETCVAPPPSAWSAVSYGQATNCDDGGGCGGCSGGDDATDPGERSCSTLTGSSCDLVCLLYRTPSHRG